MLGRTKATLWATRGPVTSTIVYMVKSSGQSLLGLTDAENQAIIVVNPEGVGQSDTD